MTATPRPRVLFVDDMQERHRAFAAMNSHCEIMHADTVERAIDYLDRYPAFDVVCLDHDMSDEDYAAFHREDRAHLGGGQVVAEWMVEHRGLVGDPRIVVHTWNPDAAVRMQSLLARAFTSVGAKPFNATKFCIPASWGGGGGTRTAGAPSRALPSGSGPVVRGLIVLAVLTSAGCAFVGTRAECCVELDVHGECGFSVSAPLTCPVGPGAPRRKAG